MNKITRRRIISSIAAVIVLALSFLVARNFSAMAESPQQDVASRTVKEIDIMIADNGTIPNLIAVDGELVAYNKIDIFAEVSGTLLSAEKPFKVGSYFPKGSVLIKVDKEEAKLALLAQKSTLLNTITQMMPDLKIDYSKSFEHWRAYMDDFKLEAPIPDFPKPIDQQEKYFVAARNLHTQFYNIKSAEERLKKYTIYTPFSGVINETSITPGEVVRVGQKLGSLMNTYNYELEVTLPVSDLKYIQIGSQVLLESDDLNNQWKGKVSRIDNQIDPSTQTVKLFVNINGNNLREGMYMRGQLTAKPFQGAMMLPRELLVNQQAVYVLKDSILELEPVDIIKITENNIIVQGIKDGARLLQNMVPGLFDGIRVQVGETLRQEKPLTDNMNK